MGSQLGRLWRPRGQLGGRRRIAESKTKQNPKYRKGEKSEIVQEQTFFFGDWLYGGGRWSHRPASHSEILAGFSRRALVP